MLRGTFLPGSAFAISTSISRTVPTHFAGPSTLASPTILPPITSQAPQTREWTPPQWSQPALTILRVTYPPFYMNDNQEDTVNIDYVFDAVFKLIHRRMLRKTSHPVLTGSNISDHAYLEPTRVSLEIGMSDAMASFSPSMWSGEATKSVAAWQKIKELQERKLIATLVTRLDTYRNMMIVEAESLDDHVSRRGLRANIIFEELISATVEVFPPVSARGMTVNESAIGTVQSTPPIPDQAQNHVIPTPPPPETKHANDVPGAGKVGSNSIWDIFVPPTYAPIP